MRLFDEVVDLQAALLFYSDGRGYKIMLRHIIPPVDFDDHLRWSRELFGRHETNPHMAMENLVNISEPQLTHSKQRDS